MARAGQLIGVGEAGKALAGMKRATAMAVARRSLLPAANHLASVVEGNAPVLTGNLKGSVRVDRKTQSKRNRKGAVDVTVIADDAAAVPVEYGTSDTPMQAFFRPAIESQKQRLFEMVARDVEVQTMAAAKKA